MSGASRYRQRPRNMTYMAWVRRQPCAARSLEDADPCDGRVEADHAGKRPGVGMKADDKTCIPLCQKHHTARGGFHGMFRWWPGSQMRAWLDSVIRKTQEEFLAPKVCPACGRSAVFRYSTFEAAERRLPICWGESESECPGASPT